MNKQELLSTYTPEQLADMLIKANNLLDMLKYSGSYLKSGLFDNPAVAAFEERLNIAQNRIKNLEEENGRLQAEVDTYNGCLLPKCTKEARRMIDENRFANVRIVTWDEWNNREKNAMNISEIQKCQEEYERILKESPLQRTIDGIAKDILEQKNNAMAMEFTRAICDLLKRYGVCVHCTETKHQNVTHNLIEEKYGIVFDSVDFSQHDKEFKDKIEELKKRLGNSQTAIIHLEKLSAGLKADFNTATEKIKDIADENMRLQCERNGYKSKAEALEAEKTEIKIHEITDFLPSEPIKVADMLISATYTRQKSSMEKTLHKAFGNNSDTVTENVYSESDLRQIAEHLLVYCNYNESEGE